MNFLSILKIPGGIHDIDRKSANFDFKNPQNISVDQITFSLHYELVMNFLWNPKDSHNRYELYIALWNRTLFVDQKLRIKYDVNVCAG